MESGLLILYTSGTSGPAKADVISQRALIARMTLLRTDLDIDADDGFIAWSPMFHMGGTEHSISILMIGGAVFVADGFDPHYIAWTLDAPRIGWLLLVPATIERVIAALDAADITPSGVKRVGAMADLLPKQQIVRLSARVQSPFLCATCCGVVRTAPSISAAGPNTSSSPLAKTSTPTKSKLCCSPIRAFRMPLSSRRPTSNGAKFRSPCSPAPTCRVSKKQCDGVRRYLRFGAAIWL